MNEFRNVPTETLLRAIELLQGIQKAHPPTHPAWIAASEKLAPRFAEMARRQKGAQS
jgi:hypothetical protein